MRHGRFILAAAAVALAGGCGLAKRSPADALAGAEEGRSERRHPAKEVELSNETIEGELTRPDGDGRPVRERQDDTLDEELTGPSSKPAQAERPTPPKKPRPEPLGGGGRAVIEDSSRLEKVPQPPKEALTAQMYFKHFGVNPTIETDAEPVSTFAVDVDTASYSMARAYLWRGMLPPEEAVRVEEFVNAFDYGYRPPEKEAFAVQVEAFPSPNRKGYHVLHVGLKGREVKKAERKASNLVFTIDVSGSMGMENRLGLVKRALELLVDQLDERDTVAIVVYGDSARLLLPPTNAMRREQILEAIHRLRPEGSTNVQAGLELAYQVAAKHLRPGGINRVVLCSDGVANNGITHADGIFARVKGLAERGITLSAVGFGMGNYNDVLMERLADTGNGNYAYVDRLDEARRIFVEQLTGTLQVIAKDVKVQLEFDPAAVVRYRLLGFENRMLRKQDFADDQVDAGEIGAGHSVTAIYEVKLRAERPPHFATLRVRFKEPDGRTSSLVEKRLPSEIVRDSYAKTAGPTRVSMVAAAFAEKLRGSYWARNLSYDELLRLWDQIPEPLRQRKDVGELRELIQKARALDRRIDRWEKDVPVAMMDFDRVPVLQ